MTKESVCQDRCERSLAERQYRSREGEYWTIRTSYELLISRRSLSVVAS